MRKFLSKVLVFLFAFFLFGFGIVYSQEADIERIATDLENPRGVGVLPDGRLIVAEAGRGVVSDDPADLTGKLSIFEDVNGDGDYDDADERTIIADQLPGYNILYQFNPGRDEVVGIGDVLVMDDGRIFYTLDDNFEVISVVEVSPEFEILGNLVERSGSLFSMAHDAEREVIYVAESTLNALTAVTLDGNAEVLIEFDILASGQQAVPSGVAVDPTTGDLVVTLFSGVLWDYYGYLLSFMVGESKVVRIDPDTLEVTDEITGLTTAIDVEVDENGTIYIVEMTTTWARPAIPYDFPVTSPDAPPVSGGYERFTGRVTAYPQNRPPRILADGLDAPTNLTYHEGTLIVSTGQGTPGRPIPVGNERTTIVGELYRITIPDF